MDYIQIKDLEVYARHGVFEEEQKLGQKFLVTLDLGLETREAGEHDDLAKSIHYGEVAEQATKFLKEHTYKLIETAAERLAQELLWTRPLLKEVGITVKKPWAPVGLPLDMVSVTIKRRWHTCIVAFGSNMGNREEYIREGIRYFENTAGIRVEAVSDIIETDPVGEVEQDRFLNGCMKLATTLSPKELLSVCAQAEQEAKRERVIHWGPRTLDMDIISYDDCVLEEADLTIPHSQMQKRKFVLEPMAQLTPYWIHPVLRKSVAQMLEELCLKEEKENEEERLRSSGSLLEEKLADISSVQMVKELPKKHVKVVFQGVAGAYSQAAMAAYFGEEIESFPVEEWSDACKAVVEGRADYAVLPIENSNAGAVSQVYDLLIEFDTYIVAETYLPVSHALLGLPGATKEDIQTVYSHPQALMQCARYLDGHRKWRQISMLNTAVSAQKIVADADKTQAAIASEISARLYGLQILEHAVNDNKNNVTRFIIISKNRTFARDSKKISICAELNHESGSLYKLLSYISIYGLNMTKIESRPIPGQNFEYRFFIDFEGNVSQPRVQSALRGICQEANKFWFLGNY